MPDARVQPLLHPGGQHAVPQHDQCGAFDIVHVDPAFFTLKRSKFGQQQAGQPGHALLIVPRVSLVACRGNAQRQVLCLTDGVNTDDFFAKLARASLVGQQGGQHGRHVACSQGLLKLAAFGGKSHR